MRQPEKIIENQIMHLLKLMGIFAWKNNSVGVYDPIKKIYRKQNGTYHMNGVSDILCIIEGRFVAIEVKTPTGKISPDQKMFILNVLKEGGVAFVARSRMDVFKNLQLFFPKNEMFKEFQKRFIDVESEMQ